MKPSRNVLSGKPERRHHQQGFLPQTSLVLSAIGSLELRLVSSAILDHTNNNSSRIWLGLVIVSNDRRMIACQYMGKFIKRRVSESVCLLLSLHVFIIDVIPAWYYLNIEKNTFHFVLLMYNCRWPLPIKIGGLKSDTFIITLLIALVDDSDLHCPVVLQNPVSLLIIKPI